MVSQHWIPGEFIALLLLLLKAGSYYEAMLALNSQYSCFNLLIAECWGCKPELPSLSLNSSFLICILNKIK
jgi:hypothetical protein